MPAARLLTIAIITIAFAGCATRQPRQVAPASPTSEGVAPPTPTPAPAGLTILAEGALQAAQPPLSLAFEAGGRLLALHVQAGQAVAPGDLIATLDDAPAQEQVAQARLGLRQAELALEKLTQGATSAALAGARASLVSAQTNLAVQSKPAPEAEIESARQSLLSAQRALAELLGQSEARRIEVAIAQQQVEQAKNALWSAQIQRDTVCGQASRGGMQAQCDAGNASVQQSEAGVAIAQLQLERVMLGPSPAEIATARGQVAQAQAALEALEKRPDPDAVAAARAQVDQAQASLDDLLAGPSAADVDTAQANIEQARLTLDAAERGLERVALRAPAAGVITAIHTAPGALVGAGSPIVTLLDETRLEFHTTNLSERDLALIRPEQSATITLKAYPDDPLPARVVRIGYQPGAPVGDAVSFPVVLAPDETALALRPGMTGRAEIR
ncbi:MAG: HlyD family efflux transporter periplasmic adaptor subunit [Anaerolineae bacterium]|nr:HlyD family efflux transporter periplasmic adaptor subunit [Anaerolineae bacterium]